MNLANKIHTSSSTTSINGSEGKKLSPERRIERVWNRCYEAIKDTELEGEEIDGHNTPHLTAYMQPINVAYGMIKEHFNFKDRRDTDERYVDHLIRTLDNIVEYTPSRLKFLIALLHDIIENTDRVTLEGILQWFDDERLAKKVALGVQLLTKKSVKDCVNNDKRTRHYKVFQEVQRFSDNKERKNGIPFRVINNKGFLTREFKARQKRGELSRKERAIFAQYNELKGFYRDEIEGDYYPRFHSKKSMVEKAIELNREYKLGLSKEEIIEVAEAALDSKDADRLDNIQTEYKSGKKKIRRKLSEYRTHFKSRIQKTKPEMFHKMETAVISLRAILASRGKEDILTTKQATGEATHEIMTKTK